MTDPTLLDAAARRARAVAPHLLPDATALPDDQARALSQGQ